MMKAPLLALLAMMGSAIAEKHLVFLAGPRQSDSSEVDHFFHTHALGTKANNTGLKGWVWPIINAELPGEKHRYFENFFWNAQNATVKNILMESIQDAWKSAEHGVIIGAEGFGNTRGDPQSVGLKTMDEIISKLNVPMEHVHVVMLYRSPRLDQWVSLYHHNAIYDYESFVCEEDYTEHLANIPMNPFMVASVYREHGWNVATIDVAGTHNKELDLSHTVACRVLPKTECQNDWIAGLEDQTTRDERVNLGEFTGLPLSQQNELEGMFQGRDCYYKDKLESDNGFKVVHEEAVWVKCGTSDSEKDRYHQLTDNEHFFDLIKTQIGCGKSRGKAPVVPSLPAVFTGTTAQSFWETHEISLLVLSVLVATFLTYQLIARFKRRQTHYVKSPRRGEDMWIDFADGAFKIENNLRSPNNDDEDGPLTDVDLMSPEYKNRAKADALDSPEALDPMTAAAKEGKSVRGMYRVGLYQDVSSVKNTPQKGDSDIEIKIKTLENEFA